MNTDSKATRLFCLRLGWLAVFIIKLDRGRVVEHAHRVDPKSDERGQTVDWAVRQVFGADNSEYSIRDVLDTAHFRGELEVHWEGLCSRIASSNYAESVGAEADVEVLETLCNEFRYARDLVTTEETEKWLAARDISDGQFQRYFEHGYWFAEYGEKNERTEKPLAAASLENLNQLRIHLMMSGVFDTLASRLGQRVVVRLTTDIPDVETESLRVNERQKFLERRSFDEEQIPGWLNQLGRDQAWLDTQIEYEMFYRFRCGETLTKENLQRALDGLSMALIQFEYDLLEVDSAEVLKEAQLSVTMDNMSVEELAREFGFPFLRQHSFLEFLPEPLQQPFLSGSVGDVVLPPGERFQLLQISSKTEPTLDNPAVRKHLQRRLLGTMLSDLDSKHIRWLIQPVFYQ